ncbi:formate dehydrogenase-N subunit alpha [Carboxydothermus islandicus]|uniref:Formate dehydrogenase-N subunit alpha n=3 Tax=Carboxydothermus islandicus TaxID=661089 RepID=A0A1L8D1A6_9THEO|nr:formate dehydrogenase-N subunit alpha [Carboxydothermus islandicus]
MTNHWIDLKNTDCALIIGANPFENHPVSSKWLMEAKVKRGAKIISVDPRFTRTSSKADIYAPLRAGTDIAFIGGMINYILENELYDHEYVANYTNASFLVHDDYKFEDGLFSGYDPKERKYDFSTWEYKKNEKGEIEKDPTLKHPRTVFQLLKQHYSRYTIDKVCEITGTPKEIYLEVIKTFAETAKRGKSGTILYAMGGTQHSCGSQIVRSYAILQLLLGNMGVPGGGVNALRGESNVQGSTDFGLLNHIITGYISTPIAQPEHKDLKAYLEKETPKTGFWSNKPKFFISYLKAMYYDKATKDNEFGYQWLPKRHPKKNYTYIGLFENLAKGELEGMLLFGQNPIVGGPNSNREREALKNLKWMVAVDLWMTETMRFWTEEAGSNPAEVQTEVFVLPAAASFEKQGSISSSGRWIQWRWKAVEPLGEAKADLDIIHMLALELKKLYAQSQRPEDEPIKNLYWDYGTGNECDIDRVAREINGIDLTTGKQVENFLKLADDGSTLCGNWIYSGFYPEAGNLAQRREQDDPSGLGLYPKWTYAWPLNRRILYNRASADPTGKPWHPDKAVIWWDENQKKWVGHDVPDFKPTIGPDDPAFVNPFIMQTDGKGWLFAPQGKLKDGPFPEHYEPWESPVQNLLSPVQNNPVIKIWRPEEQSDAQNYPYVAITYRVSEHWQAGAMTRNLPWQAELVPEMFVEIGEELARELGVKSGDEVIVENKRGSIKVKAYVTKRMKPLMVNGIKRHQVGLPWHFGFQGLITGEIANKLTPYLGDANTMIPEYKGFLVNVRRAK